ncbi:MAG TPA: hypothetical protein VJJ98_11040 [Sedimentisphaerales bacterium]|nr:hypothetical protein [Sedimentisphaerales bacterium]
MPEKSLRHGTIESQMQLTGRLADETAAQARKKPPRQLREFYLYAATCFDYAVQITELSRSTKETQPSQFVALWAGLDEYLKRVNELLKKYPLLLNKWPPSPGISFAWRASWSALGVALKFAEMIYAATQITRGSALGRFPLALHEITTSGPEAQKWRDLTIQELRTRTLPKPSEWAMWEVHRDSESLMYKLEDEFLRATSKAGETEQEIAPGIFGWIKGWLWKLYEKTLKVVVEVILEKSGPKSS